jgi:hypothetical protein
MDNLLAQIDAKMAELTAEITKLQHHVPYTQGVHDGLQMVANSIRGMNNDNGTGQQRSESEGDEDNTPAAE